MAMKTGKYRGFHIIKERDKRGRIVHIVFLQYIPVARFDSGSVNERKLAAIDLVEKGVCTQKVAGNICGFHRNTVFKLIRTKRILGIEAIIEDNRGLKAPYKYIGRVRSCIKKLLRKYPDWTDQAIAEEAAKDLEIEISRSAVARIRTEKQERQRELPTKAELMAMAIVADAVDRRNFDNQQMELNFKWDKEVSEKIEQCSKEAPLQAKSKSDQRLIERLQQGQRFSFSGELMHHLFLQEIRFDALSAVFPANPGAVYQSCDILSALFHSINLDIPSIEALKLVNSSDLGICMGMNQAPEKETIRAHLASMAEHYLSHKLIDQFARVLLKRNFIDPEVFFIDGHFLPYYGLNVISKGYFTVRRLAMRGNELYAITDLQGRPLFFITESNEIDFRPIISRSASKLIEYGINRPILVFDRGGYGVHFFKELDKTAEFVTWAKYVGKKSLADIPDSAFTVGMRFTDHKYLIAEQTRAVKESVQTAKREGRSEPTSIELRMVVLENIETGKRIAIYTNNKKKPLSDIAYYMLNRWGNSENIFKEMMARFNLNYHPGYDIKELENQPLVDNPDIALIKKAIRILKKEIEELEKEIILAQVKEEKRPDKRRRAKISTMKDSIIENNKDIAGFEDKLSQLPLKIFIIDLLKGRSMSRCDLEKKKLYDLMQFMAYNSRERLVEIFRDCYSNHRDVKPVLDMITRRAGYIKMCGGTLIVVLDWIENKKHRQAAVRFCRRLNQTGIKLMGRLKLKLAFYISKYPIHGSTAMPEAVHSLT
ncbi:MAG: helix-turn-helix domain-containing protein [Deltaproteobacteria bacterium]|nr:helix-turn-helix domain-containing protein [Deltaproteobacteria bacterium]